MIGPLCAFLSSLTWAIGSSAYSRLSRQYSPFAINFSRALIALPCFILVVFLYEQSVSGGLQLFGLARPDHFYWFALSMLCSYGLADTLFFWSTQSLGVPGALAIASCFPLITAIAEWIFFEKALSVFQWLGLVLTVSCVVLVILSSPKELAHQKSSHPKLSNQGLGFLLAAITTCLWAVNTMAVSQGGRDLPAGVANAIRMVFALLISFSLGRVLGPKTEYVLPKNAIRGNLWIMILEGYGGSMFFMYGLSHSPLVLGSALASLAPVLSVPIAWWMGTEKPSFVRSLAITGVVLGLFLLISG